MSEYIGTGFYLRLHTGDPGTTGYKNVSAGDPGRQEIELNSAGSVHVNRWLNYGSFETLTNFSVWESKSPNVFTCHFTLSLAHSATWEPRDTFNLTALPEVLVDFIKFRKAKTVTNEPKIVDPKTLRKGDTVQYADVGVPFIVDEVGPHHLRSTVDDCVPIRTTNAWKHREWRLLERSARPTPAERSFWVDQNGDQFCYANGKYHSLNFSRDIYPVMTEEVDKLNPLR